MWKRKKCNNIWSFAYCIFSPSGIMLNTWIAGVNQGEEIPHIPFGLKPYQLCSFFLIKLKHLACTSSLLSFCVPAVLKPIRVLSLIPRIQFLLAFTHMCNHMCNQGQAPFLWVNLLNSKDCCESGLSLPLKNHWNSFVQSDAIVLDLFSSETCFGSLLL